MGLSDAVYGWQWPFPFRPCARSANTPPPIECKLDNEVNSTRVVGRSNEAREVLVSAAGASERLGTMRQQQQLLPVPRWAHPSVGEAVGTRVRSASEQVRLLSSHMKSCRDSSRTRAISRRLAATLHKAVAPT